MAGKYKDKYIDDATSITEKEIEKIERVSEAIEKRYDAEARRESHLKMRILFQRTAPEILPFVIYCLTFAPIATYSLFKVIDLKGTPEFYWGLGGLFVIMILPFFVGHDYLSKCFLDRIRVSQSKLKRMRYNFILFFCNVNPHKCDIHEFDYRIRRSIAWHSELKRYTKD